MKFIILQDNPEYYQIVLPYFYKEWSTIYENNNLYSLRDIQTYYENKKQAKTFIFINDRNQFIASYTLFKNNKSIFLGDVYVAPTHRKNNIGTNLIKDAIKKVAKTNDKVLYLYSYEKTLEFYKSQGFFIEEKYNNGKYLLKYYLVNDMDISTNYFILYIFIFIILILLAIYYI
jgi:predicted GNAT family N-acyltransferase